MSRIRKLRISVIVAAACQDHDPVHSPLTSFRPNLGIRCPVLGHYLSEGMSVDQGLIEKPGTWRIW